MNEDNAQTHARTHARTNTPECILILFTRYPIPGSAKTRLIPALGPEGAADLHRLMTEHTLEMLGPLDPERISIQVRYEGGDRSAMKEWLGENYDYSPQGEGDLGNRMGRAFSEGFREGFEKVILVGTDCPSLNGGDIEEALKLLADNTLVLGPAVDGGYYLIGMGCDAPPWLNELLFENIPWGTDQVYNATMNVLAETGLDVGLLDEKADVDGPEDLEHWEAVANVQGTGLPSTRFGTGRTREAAGLKLSVIIPALNEEGRIGETLNHLKGVTADIVVADGNSTDRTVEICERSGVRVVRCERGRARQMNAGASAAAGNVFLFLHADTRLPEGFERDIRYVIEKGAVGGAFLFGTDLETTSMNIVENMAHFRSIRLGIVFGDQAIFATREAFYRAGTFPDQPIMEDYEFWRRLGRIGTRQIIHRQVSTSERKWVEQGVLRLTLFNQTVMWLYLLGFGPERLARWYRRKLRITA